MCLHLLLSFNGYPGRLRGIAAGRRCTGTDPISYLVYGVCRYSRAGESLTSLAWRFGISLSGLTMARSRVEGKLGRDKRLREAWSQIEQTLQELR